MTFGGALHIMAHFYFCAIIEEATNSERCY